jgi:streptomycin 6-kinase
MYPAAFVRNVGNAFGADGRGWLERLPALTADVARDWGISLAAPYPLSFNYVAPGRRSDGTPVVLKLGVPQAGHLAVEADALGFFGGTGAVEVLARDDARGALLLERADPGEPLRTLAAADDERATAVLIDVMRRLHRPAPALSGPVLPGLALPELAAREAAFAAHLARYPGDDWPIPRRLVQHAAGLMRELCGSAARRVVLHGDLHHDNVLAAGWEPWLVIDPHGVLGDPGYEIGAALYNPLDDEAVPRLLPARVEQFADGLGMPVDRVVAWGFVQAVLSEVWDAEGGHPAPGQALQVALALRSRLP